MRIKQKSQELFPHTFTIMQKATNGSLKNTILRRYKPIQSKSTLHPFTNFFKLLRPPQSGQPSLKPKRVKNGIRYRKDRFWSNYNCRIDWKIWRLLFTHLEANRYKHWINRCKRRKSHSGSRWIDSFMSWWERVTTGGNFTGRSEKLAEPPHEGGFTSKSKF